LGGAGAGDLLLEQRELAALRLEGDDGLVNLRDLGLLHEHVPHLALPVYTPSDHGFAAGGVDGGVKERRERRKGGLREETPSRHHEFMY
jgi:hypothetical protein